MIREAEFDSVLTMRVGNGKNSHDNLPSAADVGGQNIAARIVRRMHGSTTGIGVRPPEGTFRREAALWVSSLLHSRGAFSFDFTWTLSPWHTT